MSRGTNNGVAGVPPGHGDIPRGIEVLVKKASVDAEFRALLLERRAEAAAEIGLELDAAEAAILGGIPREQLEAIIARTRVRPGHQRRALMGRAGGSLWGTAPHGSHPPARSGCHSRWRLAELQRC